MFKLTKKEITEALLQKFLKIKQETISIRCKKNLFIDRERNFTKGKLYTAHKQFGSIYTTNDLKQQHWIYMGGKTEEFNFFHEYFILIK